MNPYDKLGVDKDADDKDIKKSYHRKAAKSHPDKGGEPDDFKELALAYSILSDPLKRMKYDRDQKMPKTDNLPQEASTLVLNTLEYVITGRGIEIDVISEMKIKLKAQRAAMPFKMAEIKKQKEKAKRFIDRIKHEDGSPYPDIVRIAINKSILDLSLQMQVAEKEHKVLKIAIEMVEYYSMPQHARPPGMIGNNTLGDLMGGRFA